MRPLSDRLREHLIGPDGDKRVIVEARGVTNADVIQRKDQWEDADSVVGFSISDAGVVRLAGSNSALLDQTTGSDTTAIQDMERFPFDNHVGDLAIIDWGGSEDLDMPITEITAHLDPDQDGAGGDAVEVAFWRLQLWRLDEYRIDPAGVVVFESMTPIGDYVEATAGGSAADVTFTFDADNPPTPKRFGAPTLIEENTTPAYDFAEGSAVTLVSIWGVQDDGSKATNTAWSVDTGASNLTTSNNRLRSVSLTKFQEGEWTTSQNSHVPRMKISTANFSEATITFTSNPFDLTAAPADAANVVFDVVAGEPGGSSITPEVAVAGSGAWVEFSSGDSAEDLGLAANQTYDVRVKLTPSTAGTVTPAVHQVSVTDRTSTIIDGPVDVQLQGGWRALLSPALVGEVPEAVISIQKGGERDYRDVASDLLADNEFDQLEFVVYIGFGDESDRADWLHIDTFFVDNVRFREAAVDFICLAAMQQLDQVLPVPPDTDTDDRERKDYENQTLKAVDEDLIQNQALLPDRFFGPGIEDDSTTVTNLISPKDNSNVLQELHALAALAGGVRTTSQGRTVFRKLHDRGNATDIAAIIPREEITRASISPGYSHRTPQHYLRWDYDFNGSEEFQQEERRTNTQALTAFNPFGLDRDPFAPDHIGRWVDDQTLATLYTRRVTETMGFGLMVWDLEITSLHPELEVGDMVAVNTDLMVARDPTIEDRVLRGSQWAVARVTAVGDEWGQRLQVWVQHYSDFIPEGDSGDVTGQLVPEVESVNWNRDSSGNVTATITCNRFARSIKFASDTSAFPSKATVQAETAQNLTDGQFTTGTLETLGYDNRAFLTVLAYEGTDGTGNESHKHEAIHFRLSINDPSISAGEIIKILATTGTAAGWTISTDELTAGGVSIQSTAERILMGSATEPDTGTGVFLGLDGSDYEFRVGEVPGAGNDYIHWDGSTLEVGGTITATSFTGSTATFTGTVRIEGGIGQMVAELGAVSQAGSVLVRELVGTDSGVLRMVGSPTGGYFQVKQTISPDTSGFVNAATFDVDTDGVLDLTLHGKTTIQVDGSPVFVLNRNDASIADDSVIGQVNFVGEDDDGGVGGLIVGRANGAWTGSSGTRPTEIEFWTNDGSALATRMILESEGQIGYRVSSDPSARADFAHIYAKDVSTSAEIFVQDEAGNASQISPHDPETGEWIFYSENVKTGRKLRVRMEELVRRIVERHGWDELMETE